MHRSITVPLLCLSALSASPLAAQETWTSSGTLALTSDYVFRGISQTGQEPALQGGVEFVHASGFYAGAWGSNVGWLSDLSTDEARISSSVEVDVYGGYRGKFGERVTFDTGLYTYYYPGDYPHGFVRPYTTEAFFGIGVGVFALKYWHSLTNLYGFADSHGSGYLDAAVNVPFATTWVFNAHAGHQRVRGISAASYTDWKLGVTYNFSAGWSLALAYVDTNADRSVYTNPHGDFLARGTGVATLTKTF
jgi:uncharacterized protein (TIGR02001 family)